MPLEAKICGLKKKEDIILSINKGASYCGFIVNYPKSHRNIKSKPSLAKLNSINKKNSKFVAVLVDPTNKDLIKIKDIKFDFIQLHGNESIKRIKEIKKICNIKIIKTIKIKEKNDVKKFNDYLPVVDMFLFDSFGFEKSKSFNHNWLKHLSKRGFAWMMAGNIGVDNLEKVAKITKIVDVSGNLETNKSKDKKKIINFLNKVKEINDRN